MTTYSQQGSAFEYDVLVIGSGLAGLFYTLKLLNARPTLRIAIISKTDLQEGNSRYAQGGIAAVIDTKEDSIASHIQDTCIAGDGLCYLPAVEMIVQEGPSAIQELSGMQVAFDKKNDTELALGQEGGHTHRRIVHSGDETGRTIIETLLQRLHEHPNVDCFENHIAVNLITQPLPHQVQHQGEVLGAYILDSNTYKIHTFSAKATVLATGGAGKTYRYTTNPMVATGDGVAMAYRAGARIGNMEFYQFHPTLLHHPTHTNFLISEAVRGEGAKLRHAETLERFMQKYAPEQMELATRDIVARAIFNEIEHSHLDFVYLDITHQSKHFLKKRFPQIYTTLSSLGIDMSQDMIPVVPAAHYQCGGVLTNLEGATDLRRLYAIGEVAFTGLHGANRLASNSLLEAIVMASKAAHRSLYNIQEPIQLKNGIRSWNSPTQVNNRRASQINAHWQSLRGEMTSYAGIVRTEAGLSDLLQLIQKRKQIIEEYYWSHIITRDFIELRNIILNAELIVSAALTRRESRGGHYREDFQQKKHHAEESIARLTTAEFHFN
jgi:L-aspartate oxidase